MNLKVNDTVRYSWKDFDGSGSELAIVKKVEADHAIIFLNDTEIEVWIDESNIHQVKKVRSKAYTVCYLEDGPWNPVKTEVILGISDKDAYVKFMDAHDWQPYSAWVDGYTQQNGNVHQFNNFSGKPY